MHSCARSNMTHYRVDSFWCDSRFEQYGNWDSYNQCYISLDGLTAIALWNGFSGTVIDQGDGSVVVSLGSKLVYSYYISPNRSLNQFQSSLNSRCHSTFPLDLPTLVAEHFNSWSSVWCLLEGVELWMIGRLSMQVQPRRFYPTCRPTQGGDSWSDPYCW